jgi:uncharacterized protein (DUF4415 family)
MPKTSKNRNAVPENPEWTAEDFKKSVLFSELSPALQGKLSSRKRGPQVAPVKRPTTVRLDAEVVDAFRAMGKGWQTNLNDALKEWLREHKKAA